MPSNKYYTKEYQYLDILMLEMNIILESKGYVLKQSFSYPYNPRDTPDFIVRNIGLRGVLQSLGGLFLDGLYPAELYIAGSEKRICVRSVEILQEMKDLANILESIIGKPVKILENKL